MLSPSRCPDEAHLQQLMLGRLSGKEATPLEEHVLHCAHCGGRLAHLAAEDAVVGALRAAPGPDRTDDEDRLGTLIEELRRLYAPTTGWGEGTDDADLLRQLND